MPEYQIRLKARALNPYRILWIAMWTLAAVVLAVSYIAIAAYTGNPWPWREIVHESGDRSLLNTVLYFEHAARELPLDLILGVAVAGSVLLVFPGSRTSRGPTETRTRNLLGVATLLVCGVILTGTAWIGGSAMLYENLLQFPTRPGKPLVWGGHWRYHLLSQVVLMLVSLGLAGITILVAKGRGGRGGRRGMRVFGFGFILFLGLAIVFVPNLDSVLDPVYIGHQFREVFTHVLVTIPAAWGLGLFLSRKDWNADNEGMVPIFWPIAAGIAGALIGSYLLISGLATSAASQGQTVSVVLLVFPHFFEHTFSYVVTASMAGFVVESARVTRSGV